MMAKHLLQDCPTYAEQKRLFWPTATPSEDKLYDDANNHSSWGQTMMRPWTTPFEDQLYDDAKNNPFGDKLYDDAQNHSI